MTGILALTAGFGLLTGVATLLACALVRAGAEGSRLQSDLFAAELRRRAAGAIARPPLSHAA